MANFSFTCVSSNTYFGKSCIDIPWLCRMRPGQKLFFRETLRFFNSFFSLSPQDHDSCTKCSHALTFGRWCFHRVWEGTKTSSWWSPHGVAVPPYTVTLRRRIHLIQLLLYLIEMSLLQVYRSGFSLGLLECPEPQTGWSLKEMKRWVCLLEDPLLPSLTRATSRVRSVNGAHAASITAAYTVDMETGQF